MVHYPVSMQSVVCLFEFYEQKRHSLGNANWLQEKFLKKKKYSVFTTIPRLDFFFKQERIFIQ